MGTALCCRLSMNEASEAASRGRRGGTTEIADPPRACGRPQEKNKILLNAPFNQTFAVHARWCETA